MNIGKSQKNLKLSYNYLMSFIKKRGNLAEYMKIRAFSLIELLVVITIVSILAAISAPVYKSYIKRSNATSFAKAVESYVDKSIEFSASHDRFGNAYDIGLNNNPGSEFTDPDYFITDLPYAGLSFPGFTLYEPNPPVCGRFGQLAGSYSPQFFGYVPSDLGSANFFYFIQFYCDFWNYNHAISRVCYYQFQNPNGGYVTDDVIPGWYNECADSDCTTAPPALQAIFNSTSYNNPECQ